MSPDMQEKDDRFEIPMDALKRSVTSIFSTFEVDGVTISGGEPMEQPAELAELLLHIRSYTGDILVYTGYTAHEIRNSDVLSGAASLAGVLVCGPYEEERNDGGALRGSSNQEIVFLDDTLRARYDAVLAAPRSIQVGRGAHDVFLVGLLG